MADETQNIEQNISHQINKVMLRQLETITPHNDGAWEITTRKCIMNGDVEALKQHMQQPFSGKRGIIAGSRLRNAKNLAIVDITIASRAALDAGINSETVYTISDGYLYQAEECTTIYEINKIVQLVLIEFANLVHELKTCGHNFSASTNEKFLKAYNYILRNFNRKLTLEMICTEAALSKNHLEKFFNKEVSCSVLAFINKVRCQKAHELIKSSSMPMAQIALLTGFCNTSHFIKLYKEHFGITPAKARKKEHNLYLINLPKTI